jgi:hypothetical protein
MPNPDDRCTIWLRKDGRLKKGDVLVCDEAVDLVVGTAIWGKRRPEGKELGELKGRVCGVCYSR